MGSNNISLGKSGKYGEINKNILQKGVKSAKAELEAKIKELEEN